MAFAATLIIFWLFLRSSAEAVGFRRPHPPEKQGSGSSGSQQRSSPPPGAMRPPRAAHRFEGESVWVVLRELRCTRRFWCLLIGYVALFSSRTATKFLAVFARNELHTSHSTADLLLLLTSLPTMTMLLCGGAAYDFLPSKAAVAIFFSLLLGGTAISMVALFVLFWTESLSLPALATIVFVYGLCHPLPLYLPFAVFSMGFGGVRHCATIVCVFELIGLTCASLFQITVGVMLSRDDYLGWFACQALIAVVGCGSMQMYFYLDWKRSPTAGTLVSAPSLPYALNLPGGGGYGDSPPRPGSPALRDASPFARPVSPLRRPVSPLRGHSCEGSPRGVRAGPGRAATPGSSGSSRATSPRRGGSTSSLAAVAEAEGDAAWPSPRRPGGAGGDGGGGGGDATAAGAVAGAIAVGTCEPTAAERAVLAEAEAYAAERSCRRQEGAAFPPVTASASSPHGYTPTSPSTRPLPDTPGGDRAT